MGKGRIFGWATFTSTGRLPAPPGITFQGGVIDWSVATGAHAIYGTIGAKYKSLGGPVGFGLPTSDEANVPSVTGVGPNTSTTAPFTQASSSADSEWQRCVQGRADHLGKTSNQGLVGQSLLSQRLGDAEIDVASSDQQSVQVWRSSDGTVRFVLESEPVGVPAMPATSTRSFYSWPLPLAPRKKTVSRRELRL